MTVVLVGVGTDSEHARPPPRLKSDGSYEYIPIAETWLTSEDRTYGALELQQQDGYAIDVVDRIRPFGSSGDWVADPEIIADHPLHYDPDFEAMTYGDRAGGGGTGGTLRRELEPGDVLGFYTGLEDAAGHLHRYIYGYFTVAEVADLSGFTGSEFRDRLRGYPENAHAKRLAGAGRIKHEDLVIVDGEPPGEQLAYPVKMSERRENRPPTYQLTEQFASEFSVEGGVKALDRKPPLICDLGSDEFGGLVGNSGVGHGE